MTTRETLVKELHQLCQRLGVRAGVLVVMTPEEHALVAIVCPETDSPNDHLVRYAHVFLAMAEVPPISTALRIPTSN